MNLTKITDISEAKDQEIHKLTTKILSNVGINKADNKFSESYLKIYNLLIKRKSMKQEFSAVAYGC
jgi:hypothetical protein